MDPLTRPDVADPAVTGGSGGLGGLGAVAPTARPDDGFHRLHPVAATIWRISDVSLALVGGGGATAIAFAVVGVHAASVVIAVVALGLLVLAWWYPQQRYRHWSYRIGAAALELRRGVWFRTSAAVPFHRIQQIDVEQGPIQRRSGVVTLRLRTAAALTEGTVPHLAAEDADRLRVRLLDAAGAARVVDDGH